MEVSVISVENIKPHHHHHGFEPFKLCLLDQLMLATHSPLILFYPMNKNNDDDQKLAVGKRLKASLSKTLNPFYPVAGRVKDNLVIDDFFDQGVPFTEARVKGHRLSDFLAPPSPRGGGGGGTGGGPRLEFLNDLLPFEPFCQVAAAGSPAQLAVQLNTFDCGGIAIGLSMYHKLMDGVTTSAFLHTWAANCNASTLDDDDHPPLAAQPELCKASSAFPPRYDSMPPEGQTFMDKMFFQRRKGASRRFVFDSNAIASLRARARSSGTVTNPTRLEALSAFIWEAALKAASDDQRGLQCFMQAVNLRPLMSPRLSKNSIGNLITSTFASCKDIPSNNRSMKELVGVIRGGIAGINDDYIKTISDPEHGYSAMVEGQKVLGEITGGCGGQIMTSSSWVGFGANDFDFGWGKPVWSGLFGDPSGNHPYVNNAIIFKEVARRGRGNANSNGGGAIEAWIRLDEDVMSLLERDPHFLQYASLNPPICLSAMAEAT